VAEAYVHGYQEREQERLLDQAAALVELLHHDTHYPAGSRVLEVGCGVGAQTVTLARRSPDALFTSVDISEESLAEARRRVDEARLTNVELRRADLFALPFAAESFDHVFVCFVLEHLREPLRALRTLQSVLAPGGTITVIEGDHGSTYFHPASEAAHLAIRCLVDLQHAAGGDALIGRRIYPLMVEAGISGVHVSPRMVYVDSSKPELVDGFIKKTFTAMVAGVRDEAIRAGMIDAATFDAGIRALYRTAEPDGVFCYTFFKGVGWTSKR
jgi:trans-aconitate methyltransferase